ncbi:DUF1513 domain-containing protein [Enterovibrio sp. ZSDZ35]|uniref:DUF1513 domain-containing protein n=1 Tax=Enterovibrio qingdaonensis TaxID=2899818 RepID=A0ABT5QPE6_9GAMM|nr:DUF1513 domain-containing protein [Enterovibrio sp. ZSDZ35]MDD1782837.1 DUF1513 domain-containing protein [Enterovibrio sp. ZSDZ35]
MSAIGIASFGGTVLAVRTTKRVIEEPVPSMLGCAKGSNGFYEVIGISSEGETCFRTPLPTRGHGIALMRERSLGFVFARRPGTFIQTINTKNGSSLGVYHQTADRKFYGHGDVFGDFLYASEGVNETSEGIIGVYEVSPAGGLRKVREFSGFGTGPHEVRVVNDTTLAVAVGGIQTQGRRKLNIDSMAPSLVLLDKESGAVKGRYELADRHLSIRHIAISGTGDVVIAQQYKGDETISRPLLAMLSSDGHFQALHAKAEQWQRFNHYIGSVACTDSQIVATSPRGNCFGVWDLSSKELVEMGSLLDASGASANQEGFALSSGSGQTVIQKAEKSPIYHRSDVTWDNHWVML